MNARKSDLISILSLFTSASTLICCALPALLVTLGLGAVVAGLVAEFPLLIAFSEHKIWFFLLAFILIIFNFYLLYGRKNKNAACEYIPGQKHSACEVASRWSKVILWISLALLAIGFFVSYLLWPIMNLFE